jgi:hypothetical protein
MATAGDDFSNEVKTDFVSAGDGNVVLPHELQYLVPVVPLILLNLLDGHFLCPVLYRSPVALVGKGGSLFGGISFSEEVNELWVEKQRGGFR